MKIGIDKGHCLGGANTGAQGLGRKEEQLTREVGNLVEILLRQHDVEVVNCTVDRANSNSESLNLRVKKANNNDCDLFVSIHFNASDGRGNGTEVYIYNQSDITNSMGQKICSNFEKLGYQNRGVKVNKDLYVIKKICMPAMLVECCFIDNKKDMDNYDPRLFAESIVKGLI
ncbi:hypothetical protein AVM15_03405 [Paraclostridium benzoelyticum]|nr:hypothetical protein AVM15_03405 [Paraclostridium benzoelyticum]